MSDNPNPSGEPLENPADDPKEDLENPGSVSYKTLRKLLGEKKRRDQELAEARATLAELQTANKERSEKELQDQKKWQEYSELKAKEAQDAKAEAEALRKQMADARKLDAILSSLPGQVERKYWGLLDLDRVAVDPSTGEIDEASVAKLAQDLQRSFPEIIRKPGNHNQPSGSPQPNGAGGLSAAEWAKLPRSEREKRKGEISDAPSWMLKGR